MQTETKTKQLRITKILKRHNFEFVLDLNWKSPFSVLNLYKHFRFNDANRSTNDATSKQATQTETKTTTKSLKFEKDAISNQTQFEAAQTGILVCYRNFILIS